MVKESVDILAGQIEHSQVHTTSSMIQFYDIREHTHLGLKTACFIWLLCFRNGKAMQYFLENY